jgi:hypothetical protein
MPKPASRIIERPWQRIEKEVARALSRSRQLDAMLKQRFEVTGESRRAVWIAV